MQAAHRSLGRDRDDRGLVEIRVRHALDQVGRSRPERGEANTRLAGQPSPDVRDERRALLVTARNELDRRIVEGEEQFLVLLAGNSKI